MPVANKRKPAQTFPNASMPVDEKRALWAALERTLPAFAALAPLDLAPRNEPRAVASSLNVSDNSSLNSFCRGSRTVAAAHVVIEVD